MALFWEPQAFIFASVGRPGLRLGACRRERGEVGEALENPRWMPGARSCGRKTALAVALCLLVLASKASALPPGSAYEKVSPADKGYGDVWHSVSTVRASTDGSRVTYQLMTGTDGDAAVALPTNQLAVRGSDGWRTEHITVPYRDYGGTQIDMRLGYQEFSDDLTRGVVLPGFAALTPDADPTQRNLYRRDFTTGATDLLTPRPIQPLDEIMSFWNRPIVATATSDLDSVVFQHVAQLTDRALPLSPLCVATQGLLCTPQAFEWRDGALHVVGVLPDGSAAPGGAVIGAGAGTALPQQHRLDRAISADGSRIFFTTPGAADAAGEIYVREDSQTSTLVSASQRSTPDPGGRRPATFLSASVDGSIALFKSCEKLTDDATADGGAGPTCTGPGRVSNLYAYHVDTRRLVNLSASVSGDVGGLVGLSDDASRVYFMVRSTIYLWDRGSVVSVANNVPASINASDTPAAQKLSAVSDDGRYVAFYTSVAQGSEDTGGFGQTFVYDAVAGTVSCASCPPDGIDATGAATLNSAQPGVVTQRPYLPRNIDDGGRLLFFESPDPLVADDTNGRVDVYRYELGTGTLTLVSTGKGEFDAHFGDASADGTSVFFVTRSQIIPGLDRDQLADLYVARVGAQPHQEPSSRTPCRGDACQGPLPEPPSEERPATALFVGPGDPEEAEKAETERVFSVHPLSRRQQRAWARSGRVLLRVRISEAGTVRARAVARIGSKHRVVARGSRRARAGGTLSLPLHLGRSARLALDRHGRLRITVIVQYENGGPPQQARVTLRRPTVRTDSEPRIARHGEKNR